ncbi:MAG: sensor histidine kinase [Dehalococcoidia bacterium]|nr:sensor histidine kinase [Dehalococcoidia bacterium]
MLVLRLLSDEERAPLTVLSTTIPLLLRAQSHPNSWNQTLRTLANSDSFFSGATLGICRLDLNERVREVLGSCGPEACDLRKESLRLADIRALTSRVLSLLRTGSPVLSDYQIQPAGPAEFMKRLLPPTFKSPLAIVPLVCNESIVGAFTVAGFDSGECSEERLQVLHILGCYLSLAIMADKYHGEKRERNSVLEVALEAHERERERIALDIHDGPIQILASAFQHMQAARDGRRSDEEGGSPALSKASGLLREAMHELRGLMNSLRPPTLDQFGLLASLEADLQELRQAGCQAELVADDVKLGRDEETSLYRIIREALTNTKNHAGACRVQVTMKRSRLSLRVGIRDWGQGFDLASLSLQGRSQGFGLVSMRKRTELLGGRFEIESEPGSGARIRLQIPIRRKGDLAHGEDTGSDS